MFVSDHFCHTKLKSDLLLIDGMVSLGHCFLRIVMGISYAAFKHLITAYRKLCSQLDWSVPNRLLPMPSDRQHIVFLGLHLERVQKFLLLYFPE